VTAVEILTGIGDAVGAAAARGLVTASQAARSTDAGPGRSH